MKLAIFLVAALQASCPAPISPGLVTPPGDAGPDSETTMFDAADVYWRACANLTRLNCAEGANPYCAIVLRNAARKHLINFHPACLSQAKSKAEVRACSKEVACE